MMKRRGFLLSLAAVLLATPSQAVEDPGRAVIGRLLVSVYHATDGDPKVAGERAKKVPDDVAERLRKEDKLRFKNYRLLGEDTEPLFRSYENWAQPLKPSDEVLVRFEAQGHATRKSAPVDLELWIRRQKIIKTDAKLEGSTPLYVLGPEWRGGRLIIAVALAPAAKKGS